MATTTQPAEEAEERVTYDWNPPSGQKQNFFYKGSAINREQVRASNNYSARRQKLIRLSNSNN
jgi:THO complex subunit 3